MLEVALNEVDTFCSRHGLVIAGYYQANEHFERSEMFHLFLVIAGYYQANEYFEMSWMLDLFLVIAGYLQANEHFEKV